MQFWEKNPEERVEGKETWGKSLSRQNEAAHSWYWTVAMYWGGKTGILELDIKDPTMKGLRF